MSFRCFLDEKFMVERTVLYASRFSRSRYRKTPFARKLIEKEIGEVPVQMDFKGLRKKYHKN